MADFDDDIYDGAELMLPEDSGVTFGVQSEAAIRERIAKNLADSDGKDFYVKVGAVLHQPAADNAVGAAGTR
jgi:hypothetical protein